MCAKDGAQHTFRLHESSILPQALQLAFPSVRAYHATEEGGVMRADITVGREGVRAQIWPGPNHTVRCYVDPHTVGRTDKYTVSAKCPEPLPCRGNTTVASCCQPQCRIR